MRISIIAAVSSNHVIGRNNQLPWHLPADLRWFKKLTVGHPIIMGRRTFESVGKPLPGRVNIVITQSEDFHPAGVEVAHSLEEALAMTHCDEVFIGGGSNIFRLGLKLANRIYLTRIEHEFDGDTFFPEFNESDWNLSSRECHEPDATNHYPYCFLIYDRKTDL